MIDFEQKSLGNGRRLIDIDGNHDVYNVVRIQGNNIQLDNKGTDIQWEMIDVFCIGLVRRTISIIKNINLILGGEFT
ncbi:TPA: hypothetical protein ACU6JA_000522 [Salmonella enterica]|uniref:Uncharacterized protein n=1 Tax=Salmonella enterica TaxID=28901 RepID=A0A402WB11_SALER|nr:hypothetical protein [Salmonella enterica]EBW8696851.1 hypothetical protein [Salmonella enterica subsp. diarizonae serovar 16:z10:e,n,x,z15]HBC8645533.1 hypothetical protein [Citrobacter koseri]EAS2068640.1 hypothetical protein [Salmonella enterica]EAU0294676.1 hypothetical protein [Salmonella enterica]